MENSLVLACVTQWSYAMHGHSRWMYHTEEFWQNVVHLRKKWQTTPVFLPEEAHEQYEKAKR